LKKYYKDALSHQLKNYLQETSFEKEKEKL